MTDPDLCCRIRKTEPLARALHGFDAWFTGRKRFQNAVRAGLSLFEADGERIKINPLANWGAEDLKGYMRAARPAAPSAGRPRLSLDRLRALHQPRRAGRGCPRRPLARQGQDRVRHSCRPRSRRQRNLIMPLWKDGRFIDDDWTIVADDAPVPDAGPAIVSLKRWRDGARRAGGPRRAARPLHRAGQRRGRDVAARPPPLPGDRGVDPQICRWPRLLRSPGCCASATAMRARSAPSAPTSSTRCR